jgi:hypothetical protein
MITGGEDPDLAFDAVWSSEAPRVEQKAPVPWPGAAALAA